MIKNDKNKDIYFGFLFPERELGEVIAKKNPEVYNGLMNCVDMFSKELVNCKDMTILKLHRKVLEWIEFLYMSNPEHTQKLFPSRWVGNYSFKDLLFDLYFLNFDIKEAYAEELINIGIKESYADDIINSIGLYYMGQKWEETIPKKKMVLMRWNI